MSRVPFFQKIAKLSFRSLRERASLLGNTWRARFSAHAEGPSHDPALDRPYRVLGLSREAHPIVVKHHYRRLVKSIHPDRLRSMGMDAGIVEQAEAALARLNHAYDMIARNRRIRT
jgi:DnaJ-domain-containing protein 1